MLLPARELGGGDRGSRVARPVPVAVLGTQLCVPPTPGNPQEWDRGGHKRLAIWGRVAVVKYSSPKSLDRLRLPSGALPPRSFSSGLGAP